jgi:hypothetical protein
VEGDQLLGEQGTVWLSFVDDAEAEICYQFVANVGQFEPKLIAQSIDAALIIAECDMLFPIFLSELPNKDKFSGFVADVVIPEPKGYTIVFIVWVGKPVVVE